MEIMPDYKVMLIVFVVFIITMFMLNKFVFNPLISHMDKREQKVTSDLELVNKDDSELLKIEKEIQDILINAKTKAYEIKEQQIYEAKKLANEKIERIQLENKEKMESFMAKLQEDRETMKSDLRSSFGDIDSLIVAKIKNI